MKPLVRFGHVLGLVLFLGSILAFAVASSVPASGDLVGLAVARRIIGNGSIFLTMPGLALLVVSGAVLSAAGGDMRRGRVRVMAIAAAAIVANATLVVLPSVRSATALAQASLQAGSLDPLYHRAYMTESIAGGINIALTAVAALAGVWRPAGRPASTL